MGQRLNIEAGQIFGRLILTGEMFMIGKKRYVTAECECGCIKKYRFDHLSSGRIKSCGCIQKIYETVKIGDVFNRLTIIELFGVGVDCKAKVRCVCGTELYVTISKLNNGRTKSCGCYRLERISEANTTHGLSKHPLHGIWDDIKQRCYNPKNPAFEYYGGRAGGAVRMCDEWFGDFKAFYDWCMANGWEPGWEPGLELDKDILYRQKFGTKTGLLYSPKYCCFVTESENCRARRSANLIEYNGVTKSLIEWSEQYNISASTIYARINRFGWSVHDALTTPLLQ